MCEVNSSLGVLVGSKHYFSLVKSPFWSNHHIFGGQITIFLVKISIFAGEMVKSTIFRHIFGLLWNPHGIPMGSSLGQGASHVSLHPRHAFPASSDRNFRKEVAAMLGGR
jgi:hypothetical protein